MSADNNNHDAIIVGAGAAGVSCAVWLARLGLKPLLIEASGAVGGLCRRNPFKDEWNASLPGMTGPQVADNLALSLEQAAVSTLLSSAVTGIQPLPEGFAVSSPAFAHSLYTRHVVLATGVRSRGLGVPGAGSPKFGGLLIGPGAHVVAQDFRGKRVAVLGGGDNALENALYALDKGAAHVRVHARSLRAQKQFIRRLTPECIVQGKYAVDVGAHTVNGDPYDVIMVFYGWEPCVEFAEALGLRRSKQGFIATDMQTAQTSCAGVYAIGEVAQRQHPCVVTALADGVTAAKAIQARLETPA
ncbi:NAD(P)/FAD-dependent oxidoreductase [Pollutimonas harenae]|uniref:NAD(P)/FAD-dependent oxidoreductase n=1 Tax=Pollutimonas harenae TaxID=657015 RepID=A0A853GS86_9BURK|nr:NAD(P)/FAD-dependent oxidoreductase [Pollutimonas harenae]NYT85041.1 NAD(P)/FAD-dependent oxidoreductase [Pollutimonas harenae]TEA72574.1 NAD(P)/FAD-dependent oxidoreductase [Pollutimonas harenae]